MDDNDRRARVFVTGINDQGDIVGHHFGEKPASRHPNPGFIYLTGESGPDDDQYWNLDEHIVNLQGEVDDVWLTGDTWRAVDCRLNTVHGSEWNRL